MASKNARYPKGFRASLFILVTPLLGLRVYRCVVEHCAGDEDAAFADQLTPPSFASKQCQSSLRNYYLRIVHSPVSAQGRLIRQIKIISRTSTCASWEEQRLNRQDKEPKLRLSLETRVAEDVTVISCKGRIAYGIEAAALSSEIAELTPQTRRVVIDLSGVELIDAAGLGALISVALTAQASQCSVTVAAPGNFIRQLLELTKLTSVFEVHRTLDVAVVVELG